MIREDRELPAELARLNSNMAPLAMRIMDGSASIAEQAHYAQRLIAVGERLRQRADETAGMVIEGEVLANGPLTLPAYTVEPHQTGTVLLLFCDRASSGFPGICQVRVTKGSAVHSVNSPTRCG